MKNPETPGRHRGYQIFMTVTCSRCGRVYEFTYADRTPQPMELTADRIGALVGCCCHSDGSTLAHSGARPATPRYDHSPEFLDAT